MVMKNGQTIKLTHKEFAIFRLFVSNPTRVYTKAMIYNLIWEETYYDDENVINVQMRRLREKIEDDPSNVLDMGISNANNRNCFYNKRQL